MYSVFPLIIIWKQYMAAEDRERPRLNNSKQRGLKMKDENEI